MPFRIHLHLYLYTCPQGWRGIRARRTSRRNLVAAILVSLSHIVSTPMVARLRARCTSRRNLVAATLSLWVATFLQHSYPISPLSHTLTCPIEFIYTMASSRRNPPRVRSVLPSTSAVLILCFVDCEDYRLPFNQDSFCYVRRFNQGSCPG